MKFKIRHLVGIISFAYIFLTCYAGYKLISSSNSSRTSKQTEDNRNQGTAARKVTNKSLYQQHWSPVNTFHILGDKSKEPADEIKPIEVEIWGKAAIGLYLWQHILGGPLESHMNGVWSSGTLLTSAIRFRFRTGPGVVPDKVPQDVRYLVLVLNGREPAKVEFAELWLDYLPNYAQLQRVTVVLLGNERCDNQWLQPYLSVNGGKVDLVFLVYDSPQVDNWTFYQWPLGVATYRGFPDVDWSSVPVDTPRPYTCNFMGTVYANSSRQTLLSILENNVTGGRCYVKSRHSWLPLETAESQADYIQALSLSDLTLSPVGYNTECYRLYEAMAYGSVPVVEDVSTSGQCAASSPGGAAAPLRLLKRYNAPVIYVRDWRELPALLEAELKMSAAEKAKRRVTVLKWYRYFKEEMRDEFVNVIRRRFTA